MHQRIQAFDIARALALVGMVIVNFQVALSYGQLDVWRYASELLSGRAASLFVILAGIGTSLAAQRAQDDPAKLATLRTTLRRRAASLWFGGFLFVLVWPADILHYYGVFLFAASWLITTRSKYLYAMGLLSLVLATTFLFLGDYEAGWNFETLAYTDLWSVSGSLRNLFLNGFHPIFPWLSFYLLGMALGRLDWSSSRTHIQLAVSGLFLVLSAQFVAALLGTGVEPMPPTLLFVLSGSGSALLVLVACARVAEHLPHWFEKRLSATGRFALTHYIAHVIVGLGTVEALYSLGPHSAGFSLLAALLYAGLALELSWRWQQRFGAGPLEKLLRKLCG